MHKLNDYLIQIFAICVIVRPVLGLSEEQFDALKEFYNATNGNEWLDNSGWEFDQNGITANDICNNSSANNVEPHGITCNDEYGGISEFKFTMNNLDGTIPSSLGVLSNLTILWFRLETNLHGTIPDSIYDLNNLESMLFEYVGISGNISSNIGKLVNLKAIYLIHTDLSGEIPHSLFNNSDLEVVMINNNSNLLMEFNSIYNDLLCNLTKLNTLTFSYNQYFNGSFPFDCIFNHLKNLNTFAIGFSEYNDSNGIITGMITDSLSNSQNLNQLESISISNTNVTGAILSYPNFSLPSIAMFNMANNSFYGTIDNSVCSSMLSNNLVSIASFDISSNSFDGTIPKCLYENTFNNYEKFGSNSIIKTQLITSSFANNQFTGTIPSNFTICDSTNSNNCPIVFFNLVNNQLSGMFILLIPSALALPTNIKSTTIELCFFVWFFQRHNTTHFDRISNKCVCSSRQ